MGRVKAVKLKPINSPLSKHAGAKFANLAIEERIERVQKLRIYHPEFEWVLDEIEECRVKSKYTAEPRCLFVTGESGTGKSEVFKTYLERHEFRQDEISGLPKRFLAMELPSPVPTPNAFLVSLLRGMGDINPIHGRNAEVKLSRLCKMIKSAGVELVLLDEFQNFVDKDKGKLMYAVSDTLKSLINKTQIPFILFGLTDSLAILRGNEQLKGRFQRHVNLPMFRYDKNERMNFKKLLDEFDENLPFVQKSGLSEPNVAAAIFSATGGRMRYLVYLIRDAAEFAIRDGCQRIEWEHLEHAFIVNACMSDDSPCNPFDVGA